MSNYRVQAALGNVNGIDEDRMVNVFHVRTPAEVGDGTAVVAQEIVFRFATFYQDIQALFSGETVSAVVGAHTMKVYRLITGAPGAADDSSVLLVDDTFSTTGVAGGAQSLVNEAAVALSLQANPQAVPEFEGIARPRSRRRGRAYLGGLAFTTGEVVPGSGGRRPTAFTRNLLVNSFATLATALEGMVFGPAGTAAEVCVYSRTDGVLRPVTEVFVDNAYDTIRSRGLAPTLRTTLIL